MLRVELVNGTVLQVSEEPLPGTLIELQAGANLRQVEALPGLSPEYVKARKAREEREAARAAVDVEALRCQTLHVSLARRLAARGLGKTSPQSRPARPIRRQRTHPAGCVPACPSPALTIADVERYLQERERVQSELSVSRLKRLMSLGRLKAA